MLFLVKCGQKKIKKTRQLQSLGLIIEDKKAGASFLGKKINNQDTTSSH